MEAGTGLTPYVPRLLLRHLAETPDDAVRTVEGTVAFVDVSGFTKLSERLARRGREGAERLADAIGSCFAALLAVAYDDGGSLLKFGGDALLLLFDGEGQSCAPRTRPPGCAGRSGASAAREDRHARTFRFPRAERAGGVACRRGRPAIHALRPRRRCQPRMLRRLPRAVTVDAVYPATTETRCSWPD